jgi:hypothetical protein
MIRTAQHSGHLNGARSPRRPGFNPLQLVAVACAAVLCSATVVRSDDKVTYDDHVAPIFKQRCGSCHNPTANKADLDVTNYLKLMQGGASGASIEPGDAESSYLYSLVTHKAEPFMPQQADKLPDAEIDLLKRWINGGALENAGSKAAKPKATMKVAAGAASSARPEVIPLPPRMVLEPALRLGKPPVARSLATSPWAPLVAVTSQRQVLLYDTKSLELVGVFPFPEGQPNVVRFSRDGQLLLVGGGRPAASGKVVVWDITTGERVFEVGNEVDVVLAADISADRKRIALGGPGRRVKVYSTETGELQYELTKHTDWVLSAEFSPDGVLLATSDRSGGLCVWETDGGKEYLTLTGHTAAVNAVAWRGDSDVLASASEDTTVQLWEMENGTAIKKWNAKAAALSIDFTREGQIITGGRDQVVRLWNQDGAQAKETKPIGDLAVSVAFCDESQRMIAADWSGAVQAFKTDDASGIGSLVTNPPTLDERLAAAQATLQLKTAASGPLTAARQKAEADLQKTQADLVAAQQTAAALQADAERLTAEGSKIGQARAAAEAQHTKIANMISQNEAARPLVAEALKQVTEAIAKVPDDAKLAEVQRQLTEQQKVMEGGSTDLQAKLAELATAVANADVQLKDINAKLEAAGKASSAAAEQVKTLAAQNDEQAKSLAAAQQAAGPAEAELANAQQAVARWQGEIAYRDQMVLLQAELEAARKVAAERQAELDKADQQLKAANEVVTSATSKRDEASRNIEALNAKISEARAAK